MDVTCMLLIRLKLLTYFLQLQSFSNAVDSGINEKKNVLPKDILTKLRSK